MSGISVPFRRAWQEKGTALRPILSNLVQEEGSHACRSMLRFPNASMRGRLHSSSAGPSAIAAALLDVDYSRAGASAGTKRQVTVSAPSLDMLLVITWCWMRIMSAVLLRCLSVAVARGADGCDGPKWRANMLSTGGSRSCNLLIGVGQHAWHSQAWRAQICAGRSPQRRDVVGQPG
jgi:hypothetical protein